MKLELFPVPGKVPLWLEEADVNTDAIGEGTVGVAVEAAGRRLVYAPGCARVTDDLKTVSPMPTCSSSTARCSPTTK